MKGLHGWTRGQSKTVKLEVWLAGRKFTNRLLKSGADGEQLAKPLCTGRRSRELAAATKETVMWRRGNWRDCSVTVTPSPRSLVCNDGSRCSFAHTAVLRKRATSCSVSAATVVIHFSKAVSRSSSEIFSTSSSISTQRFSLKPSSDALVAKMPSIR